MKLSQLLTIILLSFSLIFSCQREEIRPTITPQEPEEPVDEVPIDSVSVNLINLNLPTDAELFAYYDVKVAEDGKIWLAGSLKQGNEDKGLLAVFDPVSEEFNFTIDEEYRGYYRFYPDYNNGFYVTPGRGGSVYDFAIHLDPSLNKSVVSFPDLIRGVVVNPNNQDLWGFSGDYLYQVKPNGETEEYLIEAFTDQSGIPMMSITESGQVYVAFWDEVFYLDANNVWQLYNNSSSFALGGFRTFLPVQGDQTIALLGRGSDDHQLIVFDDQSINRNIENPFSKSDDLSNDPSRLVVNQLGFFATDFANGDIRFRPAEGEDVVVVGPENSILDYANLDFRFDVEDSGKIWLVYGTQFAAVDESFLEL